MKKHTRSTAIPTYALKAEALASMSASFERFLPCRRARDAERDAGAGCDGGLWRAPRAG